jgi:hypothetical protein
MNIMSGRMDYFPQHEGPLWPDEAAGIGDEASLFLAASDEDVRDEVARQDIKDMAHDSFKLWLQEKLTEISEQVGFQINPDDLGNF